MNERFVSIAEKLKPVLYGTIEYPKSVVEVIKEPNAFQGWRTRIIQNFEKLVNKSFGKGDSFTLDFGNHFVGKLKLSIKPVGSPPDAPLRMKLIFGEMPCEVAQPFEEYDGWISSSWLQEEIINIDILPGRIELPRRYSFRYLKITILDTSRKYKVAFDEISCETVTSGDVSRIEVLPDSINDDVKLMDRIGSKTLQDCMQTVFEDGPKRDRRLWIGDLRLQALANMYTFKNYNLVKRCLYLFAGLTDEKGQVPACVFEFPEPHADDTFLYDYSLFFVSTLYDYVNASKDMEALRELWPTSLRQIELSLERLNSKGIVKDSTSWWCFTDWHEKLNKQASGQAVLIYCLKKGLLLAEELKDINAIEFIKYNIGITSRAAIEFLWDEESGFFTSGSESQISWASQIWMVLAEVFDKKRNAQILDNLFLEDPPIRISTPYMYHHLIEALIVSGRKDKALEMMRGYWGEMIKDGADTYWELYNPEDKFFSPYGSNLINSYCHAWSCTPTYFIRKYFT